MATPYSRKEVAYLVGPLLDEDPDRITDIVIIALVEDDSGEQRLRMRGPAHTPLIIGSMIANSILAEWEAKGYDDS